MTTVLNDVVIRDEGTILVFEFRSDAAKSWSDDHVNWDSWQKLGPYRFGADRRPGIDLIDILREQGFRVGVL